MTHNQWEQGKRLTIHNATKEQLKFMVRERESMIQDLTKQLDEKQKALEDAIKVLKNLVWNKIFIGRMEKRYDLFRISKKDKECI